MSSEQTVRPAPSPLALLIVVGSLMTMSALATDVMLPAFPTMARDLGVSAGAIQGVLSVFMLGYALPQLVIGSLADRFGRKPILLAGLAVYGLGSVLCLLVPYFTWLLVARFFQGTGAAAGPILSRAVLRDLYSGQELGRMLSFAMVFFTSAPLLAPSIGAIILRFGDWQLTFVFLLFVAIALVALVLLVLPETLAKRDLQALNLRGMLANGKLVFLDPRSGWPMVLLTLGFAALMAYLTSAPALLITYFGLSETTFALLFSAIASVSFITQPINARLLRSHSSLQILRVVVPLFVLVSVIMALQVLAGVATLTSLAINLMAFFACFSLTLANGTVLALDPHQGRAGMASGLMGFAQMAVGTLLGTFIGSFSGSGPLPLTIGIAVLACLMYPVFRLAARAHG
jgi:DHA1 family bicyclomycin/chloramphenicol resistance-like MFS transporter